MLGVLHDTIGQLNKVDISCTQVKYPIVFLILKTINCLFVRPSICILYDNLSNPSIKCKEHTTLYELCLSLLSCLGKLCNPETNWFQVKQMRVYKSVAPFNRRLTAVAWHPHEPNVSSKQFWQGLQIFSLFALSYESAKSPIFTSRAAAESNSTVGSSSPSS